MTHVLLAKQTFPNWSNDLTRYELRSLVIPEMKTTSANYCNIT